MHISRALLAAALLAGITTAASAQATAMFRGDAGHSGRYADPGATAYGGIRWRFQTDGPVRSSPAVTATTVYIGSNDGHLYALDRQSGTLRWKTAALGQLSASPAEVTQDFVAFKRTCPFSRAAVLVGAQNWLRDPVSENARVDTCFPAAMASRVARDPWASITAVAA